jgi:hypothetical protein
LKFVDQFNDEGFSDPERDIPNVREVHLNNGRTFKMERKDPYGFVSIKWDFGNPPETLRGMYTSFDAASKALMLFINNNLLDTVVPDKVEKAPPLPYKKKYRDPVTGENLPVG